jgi:hypothetical protein
MMAHRNQPGGSEPADAAPAVAEENAGVPLEISHARMDAAYDTGEAVPLGETVPWLVRYHSAWWVIYEGGWLRVTDALLAADLDHRAAQMTEADASAARSAAIREAVTGASIPAPAAEHTPAPAESPDQATEPSQ